MIAAALADSAAVATGAGGALPAPVGWGALVAALVMLAKTLSDYLAARTPRGEKGRAEAEPAAGPAAPAPAAVLSAEDRARLERIERLLSEVRDGVNLRQLGDTMADVAARVRSIDERVGQPALALQRELAEVHAMIGRILDAQRVQGTTLAGIRNRVRELLHELVRRHA